MCRVQGLGFTPEQLSELQTAFENCFKEMQQESKDPTEVRKQIARLLITLSNAMPDFDAERLKTEAMRIYRRDV
jgi:hypothetical protein